MSTTLLVRSVLDRRFLMVGDLVALMGPHTEVVPDDGRPVTYIGLERPEGLPDGSDVITVGRLAELVPV